MRVFGVALVVFAVQAGTPTTGQIQTWYESGEYEEVVQGAAQQADPLVTYLAGSSYERLNRFEQARQAYQQLVDRGEADPWALIGRSAQAVASASVELPAPEVIAQRLHLTRKHGLGRGRVLL